MVSTARADQRCFRPVYSIVSNNTQSSKNLPDSSMEVSCIPGLESPRYAGVSKRLGSTYERDRLDRTGREHRHSSHLPYPLLEDYQPLTGEDPRPNQSGGVVTERAFLYPLEQPTALSAPCFVQGEGETPLSSLSPVKVIKRVPRPSLLSTSKDAGGGNQPPGKDRERTSRLLVG